MKKTALYYPEIAIPSGTWLRQAVLYFDELASIVPASITRWTERQLLQQTFEGERIPELAVVSDDLYRLESEGLYRPILPESLVESYGPEREEFSDDFVTALLSTAFQSTLGDRRAWILDSPIHVRKGTPGLFGLMIQEGYAKIDPVEPGWLLFERSTSHLYMSILAKHLARRDAHDTVPSTSGAESKYRDIAFRVGNGTSGMCVADLLFSNVLPCPKPGTPIGPILKFKRKRRDELGRFRECVSSLEASLSKATSPEDIKSIVSDFGDRERVALSELNKSFVDAAFDITMQSIQSLVQIRSPTLWLTSAALAGKCEVASLPVTQLAFGAGFSAFVQVSVVVASGVKKQVDENKSNAFAYVHYAQKELG